MPPTIPSPSRRALVPTLAALLLTASAVTASGYVLYFTDGGQPLRWKREATSIRVATVDPAELALEDVEAALDEGFAAWAATGCTPVVTRNGRVDATQGARPKSVNAAPDNVVVFIETADHWSRLRHGKLEIAVTVIANNSATGEIVDADIEVNDAGFQFSVAATPGLGRIDLRSTLTHELGHFFGLDHSLLPEATMFASYDEVDPTAKRSLHVDDIDGVCALAAVPFPPADDDCSAAPLSGWLAALIVPLVTRRRRRRLARG